MWFRAAAWCGSGWRRAELRVDPKGEGKGFVLCPKGSGILVMVQCAWRCCCFVGWLGKGAVMMG